MVSETVNISVLHVDDEPDFADLAADMLEREDDRFTVTTAMSASEGLERLAADNFDCIVSDYDMPGQNGIDFLTTVREEYPALPFVLFTGRGGEEIASEAISAGITDYIQKKPGTEQYELLGNRILNAVDRYRTERERRQWKEAVKTAAEGIAIVSPGGEFLQMNDAYAGAYGESPAALVGTNWREWYPDTEVTRFEETVLPTLRQEGVWEGESTGKRSDGTRFEQRLSLSLLDDRRHVCVLEDISEQRRREGALSALHDATRELMSAPDRQTVADRAVETARSVLDQPINGVWLYDDEADVLRPAGMTDRAREVIGDQPVYSGGDSLSWEVFQRGEIEVYNDTRDATNPVNPDTPIRSEVITPLGDQGVMNMGSTEPADFDAQDVSMARILGNTIEAALDRASREQRLRTQREELKRHNEHLERFTGVVSHDLRNPLQVADGRLELARQECDSPHLDDIETALTRMETLIDDVLALAREGKPVEETAEVVLSDLVRECWKGIQAPETTLIEDTDATIRADPTRLRQFVQNLLRNAVEHSSGAVTVSVGDTGDGFYVADSGPGIPPEKREEVFETGYSTVDGGTGLGLNIVQEIAEAHGWEISVTDSENGGARFDITGVETAAE